MSPVGQQGEFGAIAGGIGVVPFAVIDVDHRRAGAEVSAAVKACAGLAITIGASRAKHSLTLPVRAAPTKVETRWAKALRRLCMFSGSITALITPFAKNGQIDDASFQRFVEWQIGQGSNGLVPAARPANRRLCLTTNMSASFACVSRRQPDAFRSSPARVPIRRARRSA